LVIMLVGALLFLDNRNIISFTLPDFLFSWQMILIGIGVLLIFSSNNKSAGSIMILIGSISLLPEFWPIVLVAIGIYILLKQTKTGERITKGFSDKSSSLADSIDELFIFSGGTKIIQSQNFKGGKITAIFGGGEIDLLDCKLSEGVVNLNVTCIFGGATIIVPKEWKVDINVTPILGAFADSRVMDPNRVYDENSIFKINGESIFGGGEVKN